MRVDADPVNGCACLIGIGILLFAGNFKSLAVHRDQIDIDDIAFASAALDGGFVVVEDMLASRVLFIGRLGQGDGFDNLRDELIGVTVRVGTAVDGEAAVVIALDLDKLGFDIDIRVGVVGEYEVVTVASSPFST